MNVRLFQVFVVVFFMLIVSHSSRAQARKPDPEAAGFSAEGLARVDTIASKLIADKKMAGSVIAISRNGKLAYLKAFGHQEVKGEKKMRLDSVFRIYSMTKGIVTAAAMMLVEEEKLDLDVPVSEYIPEFGGLKVYDPSGNRKPGREMTTRDLMRHTAGLTYGFFGTTPVDEMYREKQVLGGTLDEMVQRLGELPLLYEPGGKWVYSVASDVLGYLVEKRSGEKLDVFLKKRIFDPLDMKDTGFQVRNDQLERFTACYGPSPTGQGLVVVDDPANSRFAKPPRMFSGGGGLVSTPMDYLRFCEMIVLEGEVNGRRLLKKKTVRMMRTNQLKEEIMPIGIGDTRPGTGFGLGFSVRVASYEEGDPGSIVGEFGWGGAASTHYWMSPEHKIAVVTMEQTQPYTAILEKAIKRAVYEAVK